MFKSQLGQQAGFEPAKDRMRSTSELLLHKEFIQM